MQIIVPLFGVVMRRATISFAVAGTVFIGTPAW